MITHFGFGLGLRKSQLFLGNDEMEGDLVLVACFFSTGVREKVLIRVGAGSVMLAIH